MLWRAHKVRQASRLPGLPQDVYRVREFQDGWTWVTMRLVWQVGQAGLLPYFG